MKALIEIEFELPRNVDRDKYRSDLEHVALLCNVFADAAINVKCSATKRRIKSVRFTSDTPLDVKDL